MQKEFGDYEIALMLKKSGFNEKCFGHYNKHSNRDTFYDNGAIVGGDLIIRWFQDHNFETEGDDLICSAPLWQQVIDWFRETHKLDVMTYKTLEGRYYPWITPIGDNSGNRYVHFDRNKIVFYDDYNESMTIGILKAIELIKNE